MVDETKKPVEPPKSGEYKFSDDEYASAFHPTQNQGAATGEPDEESGRRMPPFKMPFRLNRKFVVIALIVIAVFVAYEFVRPKQPVEPQVPAATPQQPVTVAPANGQVANLQQQVATNNSSIQTLQGQVAGLQNAVSSMTTSMQGVQRQMQAMTSTLHEVLASRHRTYHRPRRLRRPKHPLHITAIIDGRAWLETRHGMVITVRPGTKLPDYGTVRTINPQQGTVTTSSGLTIRYGANDL